MPADLDLPALLRRVREARAAWRQGFTSSAPVARFLDTVLGDDTDAIDALLKERAELLATCKQADDETARFNRGFERRDEPYNAIDDEFEQIGHAWANYEKVLAQVRSWETLHKSQGSWIADLQAQVRALTRERESDYAQALAHRKGLTAKLQMAESEVARLTRELDEIARALGVAYEADGHNVQAAPLPVILERAEKLTREAWSWMELAQERGAELERMRAAVEFACKQRCGPFLDYGRHAPECLAYELLPDEQARSAEQHTSDTSPEADTEQESTH